MKYWKRATLLVVLLQVGGVGGLEGQFLDWIHKMTGPGFARIGIQQFVDIKSPNVGQSQCVAEEKEEKKRESAQRVAEEHVAEERVAEERVAEERVAEEKEEKKRELTQRCEYVNAVGFALMYGPRVSDGDDGAAEHRDIDMWSVQVTIETPLLGSGFKKDVNLMAVVGIAMHRFGGGAIDGFVNGSFPAQVVLRVPFGSVKQHSLRVGTGFNVFWFPEDAFDPLGASIETAGFEGAWGGTIGFDFRVC